MKILLRSKNFLTNHDLYYACHLLSRFFIAQFSSSIAMISMFTFIFSLIRWWLRYISNSYIIVSSCIIKLLLGPSICDTLSSWIICGCMLS